MSGWRGQNNEVGYSIALTHVLVFEALVTLCWHIDGGTLEEAENIPEIDFNTRVHAALIAQPGTRGGLVPTRKEIEAAQVLNNLRNLLFEMEKALVMNRRADLDFGFGSGQVGGAQRRVYEAGLAAVTLYHHSRSRTDVVGEAQSLRNRCKNVWPLIERYKLRAAHPDQRERWALITAKYERPWRLYDDDRGNPPPAWFAFKSLIALDKWDQAYELVKRSAETKP